MYGQHEFVHESFANSDEGEYTRITFSYYHAEPDVGLMSDYIELDQFEVDEEEAEQACWEFLREVENG